MMFSRPKFKYSIEKNTPGVVEYKGMIAITNNPKKEKVFLRRQMNQQKDDGKEFLLRKRVNGRCY